MVMTLIIKLRFTILSYDDLNSLEWLIEALTMAHDLWQSPENQLI